MFSARNVQRQPRAVLAGVATGDRLDLPGRSA